MQRINKYPSAILTSDWHLRETQPICRTDNFYEETQWKKVDFISELQKQYNCPVLHAGDLFDHWKPSPWLLSETIKHIPEQFFTIYGNHDLPQHNMDLKHKSGIHVLDMANKIRTFHLEIKIDRVKFEFCNWNETPCNIGKYLIWHVMNYQGKKPWPDCPFPMASKLLRQYPQYDLIVTGDNHASFVEEYEGRLLVNPGSIFRMDADQINHKPRVYLWYAETNTVEPIYLPIEDNIISREHIERTEKRNERIDAFVSKLNNDWEKTVSFEDNLENFKQSHKILPSVMNIIYKSIEYDTDN